MTKNKLHSHNIQPEQRAAHEAISEAAAKVIAVYKELLEAGELHALENELKVLGLQTFINLRHAHKKLYDRVNTLSFENECLKLKLQSVEQDKKDYEMQNQWIERLLEKIDKLENDKG